MTSTPVFHQSGSLCFYVNQTCRFEKRLDSWFESFFLSDLLACSISRAPLSFFCFFPGYVLALLVWCLMWCAATMDAIVYTQLVCWWALVSHTHNTDKITLRERERDGRCLIDWNDSSVPPSTSTKLQTDVGFFYLSKAWPTAQFGS